MTFEHICFEMPVRYQMEMSGRHVKKRGLEFKYQKMDKCKNFLLVNNVQRPEVNSIIQGMGAQ